MSGGSIVYCPEEQKLPRLVSLWSSEVTLAGTEHSLSLSGPPPMREESSFPEMSGLVLGHLLTLSGPAHPPRSLSMSSSPRLPLLGAQPHFLCHFPFSFRIFSVKHEVYDILAQ